MAKKEAGSKGVIKSLLSRAWEKVKDLPRRIRGTKADVEAKERKKIAEKTGRDPKQIRDIEKGKRPGRNLLDSLKAMKAGRKVEAPPKAKPTPEPKAKPEPVIVSPIDKASGQLAALDKGGVDKVMVHITSGKTGRSITLGAKGGINVDSIRGAPSLGDFLAVQGGRQQYEIDWDDVIDIEFEEY